jgi:hypothetical protein
MTSRPLMCSPQAEDHTLPIVEGSHPTTSLKKPCCASQHFSPPDFRNGSKREITAAQHWYPLQPISRHYAHKMAAVPLP